LKRWYNDEEIRRAVDGAPPSLSYLGLARALRTMFPGRDTPSKSALARYSKKRCGGKARTSRIDKNGALREFVKDHIYQLTIDEIVTGAEAVFGPRCTSRSAVHRYRQRCRAADRGKKPR